MLMVVPSFAVPRREQSTKASDPDRRESALMSALLCQCKPAVLHPYLTQLYEERDTYSYMARMATQPLTTTTKTLSIPCLLTQLTPFNPPCSDRSLLSSGTGWIPECFLFRCASWSSTVTSVDTALMQLMCEEPVTSEHLGTHVALCPVPVFCRLGFAVSH